MSEQKYVNLSDAGSHEEDLSIHEQIHEVFLIREGFHLEDRPHFMSFYIQH